VTSETAAASEPGTVVPLIEIDAGGTTRRVAQDTGVEVLTRLIAAAWRSR
jgi:hypothetical protein